ncbi:hypothetical protein [Streptomyces hoynatensis]|uniref:Uncharacterized protein n=1 Tax=Streptomyces hoynatensis TaxID=1141874 RepID=A0A3A9YSN3_9ACTN|nr:hypothetical protein [Streptomyces hoynatensis]RKN38993.1 hypothetical protein D7294_22695 [Streptomyces hoynatensis]
MGPDRKSPAPAAAGTEDPVRPLAEQMRQALQTCSVHTVGPVAAFEKCTTALEGGRIDYDQFQEIGRRVASQSRERIRAYESEGDRPETARKINRERRMITFVDALFSLDPDPAHDGKTDGKTDGKVNE